MQLRLEPSGSLSLFSRRLRFGKFRVIDRRILLNFCHLDGESPVRSRHGPLERDLHPFEITIIGIVDFGRIPAQRGLNVADNSNQ